VDVLALCPGETRTEFHERAHAKRQFSGHDPAVVVEKALAALGRKPTIVPGFGNKLIAFMHRVFPRRFTAHSTGAVLARSLLLTNSKELRSRPYFGSRGN
jgi:short-subunit dehydrogenase